MTKLTNDDKAEINRLVDTMRDPSVSKIARKINRGYGSVVWYMMTHGLLERPLPTTALGGKRAYLPQHDARIEQLSLQRLSNAEIASVVTKEFGITRNAHSVRCRLARLAIIPDEQEAA